MILTFRDKHLQTLCNSREALLDRFGDDAAIVERRLLVLDRAKMLGEVTIQPPDRRRREKKMGSGAYSVCARGAGRVYFEACEGADPESIDTVEITFIGWRT